MIQGPRRLHLFVNLVRPRANRMFLGVCAGLAARFQTDPVWFRIGFVALALLFGKGVLLYLILCVVMPSTDDQSWSSRNSCTIPSDVR